MKIFYDRRFKGITVWVTRSEALEMVEALLGQNGLLRGEPIMPQPDDYVMLDTLRIHLAPLGKLMISVSGNELNITANDATMKVVANQIRQLAEKTPIEQAGLHFENVDDSPPFEPGSLSLTVGIVEG